MERDFARELGYLGFTMRLKRISDAMMHEGRRLYNELGVDIEPNWYIAFKMLKSRGPMSVTEIADSSRVAHPSVIKVINKMIDAGYLVSYKDEDDSRKRLVDLSAKAKKKLPEFEKIWEAGEQVVEEAVGGLNALQLLSALEDHFLDQEGFSQRTINELKLSRV